MIEIKKIPLHQCVDRLKNNKYFSFVRYGDGEWIALCRGAGKVSCRLQSVNRKIQADMLQSLVAHANAPRLIFGMQHFAVRRYGTRIERFLHHHKLKSISWVEADVFHYASLRGLLYPLIKQLCRMKVVIVGPHFLHKIKDGVFDYSAFVEVPPRNCYAHQESIKSNILSIHEQFRENVVYSFCCGPLAETLILKLQEKMPENFLIDFGSLWDVFCGVRSRRYTKSGKYTDDILKRNLGRLKNGT